MASTWDHERDKKLLLAIMAVHSPLDYAAIAKAMGQGDSTAAVKKHVYTLKAQRAISAQSLAKAKTDKPTDCGDKGTKTTTKRKIDSPTMSEDNSIVENQDEDGFESSSSPNKQRKL
ncbi:uncharacterized protein N7518_007888 [Penicillium psychrosexuale]|uniref:uncharacterized protein n=1 Tax=Penicillium psychrosexuale TaxID=1002107 RepID=UPI00254561D1|nr:uncharacterized protein N7518_007888 [Penicillium psychrosexuale]KAJ5790877.1 hypothetical protein N7518_007888 [Penicillium psychrosexuale]